MVRIVVDAYAWIEVFLGSEKGQFALQVIQEAELVLTPGTVLTEISSKYLREGVKEDILRSRLKTISESSEVSPIDEELAVASGMAYLQIEEKAKKSKIAKPSLFDGIVLGTARVNEAKVLTGDIHFKDLEETVWMK